MIRHALWLAELGHRGDQIHAALLQRAAYRRRRRGANLRHRSPRFHNRRRPPGWLSPSLRSRVTNILTWVRRLCRWAPITQVVLESVRFDTQALQNPEISGIEYQQGTLFGYEVREYLLGKWGRQCAYCGQPNCPLQVEHILARANGGTDRISNLTLACRRCNDRKGKQLVEQFLAHDPVRLARILAQARVPLRDAAVVNSTSRAVLRALQALGLSVETATGGRTKWNRTRLHQPKTHALDALCVGRVATVYGWAQQPLRIQATGQGQHQRTQVTRHGLPRGYLSRRKSHFGFRTGDLVRAVVPTGKHRGVHVGRVAVRASGSFDLRTPQGLRQGIAHRHCRLLQRADGYAYGLAARPVPPPTSPERRLHQQRTTVGFPE